MGGGAVLGRFVAEGVPRRALDAMVDVPVGVTPHGRLVVAPLRLVVVMLLEGVVQAARRLIGAAQERRLEAQVLCGVVRAARLDLAVEVRVKSATGSVRLFSFMDGG